MMKPMKSAEPGPIAIPEDIAAKCDGPNEFENFGRLFRAVIAVPKKTIDEEEAKRKRKQAKKLARSRV
jgi:hypothetical protein